jgi:class 3 adenylate cyclase
VNVTGRLLDLAKQTNNDVLASETFQALCGQPLVDLGEHPLRDISGVLRVFTLPYE